MKKFIPVKYFRRLTVLVTFSLAIPLCAHGQGTYYIDGYHGGVWGHYPDWNTRFMVDMLKKHLYWNINLEIARMGGQRSQFGRCNESQTE